MGTVEYMLFPPEERSFSNLYPAYNVDFFFFFKVIYWYFKDIPLIREIPESFTVV